MLFVESTSQMCCQVLSKVFFCEILHLLDSNPSPSFKCRTPSSARHPKLLLLRGLAEMILSLTLMFLQEHTTLWKFNIDMENG